MTMENSLVKSGVWYDHSKQFAKAIGRKVTLCLLLFVFCFSCSFSTKEEGGSAGWSITVSGKVGFPQQGQIIIQEIKNGALGWQDTVTLKKNYTFSKKINLSQPGYYKINFFNRQFVDLILYKSNIEVNVDGNDPNGFAEVKGSPEIEVIRKTQALMREGESSPEMVKLNDEYTAASQQRDQQKMSMLQEAYMLQSVLH